VDPLDCLRSALADRYLVQREIGRGGMAIVYLAHDLRDSRDVAIKVLRPEFAMAVSAERFLREIQIEGKLKHPKILPLLDSGDADGLPYYTMPYVAGCSLQGRLSRDAPLPLAEATSIAIDVAEALAYAHDIGVVHRDVKPGNILLEDGHAWLADFGIARAITILAGDRLSESGVVIGTPEYMSPEQGAAHGRVDGRSDIYSLGCVLYEMLCGEPPFTGPSAQVVIARHMHEAPRSLRVVRSAVPEHIEEAIQVALAKIPADRFSTATEFISAMGPAVTSVNAIFKRQSSRPYPHRRRHWAIGLGTALAGLILTQSVRSPRTTEDPRSTALNATILVSPFQTRIKDSVAEAVAHSITDAVGDSLARVGGLRVVRLDAQMVADSVARRPDLGVLILGSVERSGDQLKVIGRVTDARSRVQLFSQGQQTSLEAVDLLEGDLVQRLIRFVRRYVGTEARRRMVAAGTRDDIAREYWKRAISILDATNLPEALSLPQSTAARLAVADSLLGEAIRRDPRWIGPHITRGWAHLESASMHGSEGQRDSVRISAHLKAIAAADSAINIAAADPDAHELRGVALLGLWFEAPSERADSLGHEAERALSRAISLDLDVARAWEALGSYYLFTGRFGEARHAIAQAQEADAFLLSEPRILRWQIMADLNLERYAEARETCTRGIRWYPLALASCKYTVLGWEASDLKSARRAWELASNTEEQATLSRRRDVYRTKLLMTAMILARAGYRDSAKSLLRTFEISKQGQVDIDGFASDEAYVRLLVGDQDRAVALLRTFLHYNWAQRGQIARTPWYRSLHGHPAFTAMMARRP
jgi:eukaryotic-like serine/threonine-protein kinase